MLWRTYRTWGLAVVLCCVPLVPSRADACNIPVFRYALERWEPHVYEVVVFHRQELSAGQREAMDWLSKCAAGRDVPCNIDVRLVKVTDKMDRDLAAVYKSQEGEALPRLVARFPQRLGPAAIAWSGPLTLEAAKALVDSPVRRKVVAGIVKGESAVWILLESGDKAKDDAAATLLERQFAELEKTLELPPSPAPEDEPTEEPAGTLPLKVAFSLVRLSRKSPAEAPFVHMLMKTEDDLVKEYASQPMTFAVFGQGRAMWALVGKGISKSNIADVCAFLVGRCSCQVKDMNPGVDLLVMADWHAGLAGTTPATAVLPDVIAPAMAASAPASAPASVVAEAGAAAYAGGGGLLRNTLLAFGCIVLVVAVLVVWVSRRPSRG